MKRKGLNLLHLLALMISLFWAPVSNALEKPAIERIQSATYEVVLRKAETDPLSYEKPLPMELVPYAIRKDKYLSIGTAFAIGPNKFVTAGHVIGIHHRTSLKGPFLRDHDGHVFEIGKVLKLSVTRDFVMFSLKNPPKGQVLELNIEPKINEKVYAVGNALGQGIVIRDGLYTSSTPEELNGAWNWIRFSAAASPGNSGGPLIDEKGRVIGVVLRKSQSENLNYALPMSEVQNAESVADLSMPLMYRIDNTDFTELGSVKAKLPLPEDFPVLKKRATSAVEKAGRELGAKMWSNHKDETFPRGRGSEMLLHTTYSAVFPHLIARGSDGVWSVYSPNKVDDADIGHNGRIWHGKLLDAWYLRIRKPDDIPLDRFYSDPKVFLDTVLKGLSLTRRVASQEIRITSMGKPEKDYVHVDRYGRKWQVRIWPSSYDDSKLVAFSLPIPGGYVTRLRWVYTQDEVGIVDDMKMLSDFQYVSYYGTLAQWQEFLKHRELLPEAFGEIHLDVNYDKRLTYRSQRVTLSYTPETMSVTPDSYLILRFSYFKDTGKPIWDVAEVVAGDNKSNGTFVRLARQNRPNDALSDSLKSAWKKMNERQMPYDKTAFFKDKSTIIATVYDRNLRSNPDLLYTVTYGVDGNRKQEQVESKLDAFVKAIDVYEYAGARQAAK